MPFQFRKRIPLVPGLVDLNVGKRSMSLTFKFGPVHYTTGHGRHTTSVDLPGPLSYRRTTTRRTK